ncbi:MAG: prepilin peptidase [Gaiellaceae bacterium]
MSVALAAAAFAPALALGSFLNVVAARFPRGRSACPACGKGIAWYDNVPLLSFMVLRGRCRSCGAAISWRYPAVELATAALVVGCVLAFGATADTLVAAAFCAALVAVSVADLEHRIVPNRIVLPAAAAVLAAQTVLHPGPEWALGALGAAGFFLLAALAYPAGMGMGDVKLALLIGAMLGRSAAVAVMVGLVAALVPSLVVLARQGAAGRKTAIPLAPFLALGGVVGLFWGERLLDAYLDLF